jgi:ribonuclease P protein component
VLARRVRLRTGRDFRAVYGRCKTFSTPRLILAVRVFKQGRPDLSRLECRYVRFGFSVSKKTAKRAHDRNKIKRRLREIVRTRVLPIINSGIDSDTILTVRQPALSLPFEELARDVHELFIDSGLLRDTN